MHLPNFVVQTADFNFLSSAQCSSDFHLSACLCVCVLCFLCHDGTFQTKDVTVRSSLLALLLIICLSVCAFGSLCV